MLIIITGLVAFASMLVASFVAFAVIKLRKRIPIKLHYAFAFMSIVFAILHVFFILLDNIIDQQ